MPEALAGAGVEGEGAVGKEIIAFAIPAPEIGGAGAGAAEENAIFSVDGESAPGIGCAALFPRIARPGVVEFFAGLRNGVESPDFPASENIESTGIARRGRLGFAATASDIDEVLEDSRGGSRAIGQFTQITLDALAEIDGAVVAEFGIDVSGLSIQ